MASVVASAVAPVPPVPGSSPPAADPAFDGLPEALRQAQESIYASQVVRALEIAKAAWPEIAARGLVREVAVCQRLISTAAIMSGMLPDGLRAGYRSLAAYAQIDDPDGEAWMLSLLSWGLAHSGSGPDSLRLLLRAESLLPRVQDPAVEARVWNNLSLVHVNHGDLQQAVLAVEKAAVAEDRIPGGPKAATCRCNLWIYRLQLAMGLPAGPDLPSVELALHEAGLLLTYCEERGYAYVLGGMADRIAGVLIDLGRLDEAQAMVNRALRATRDAQRMPGQARLELRMAVIERLRKRYRVARAHMGTALELATSGEDRDLIARCHLENCQLQQAQNNWRMALDAYQHHAALREAMLRDQAERRVLAVELRHEFDQDGPSRSGS